MEDLFFILNLYLQLYNVQTGHVIFECPSKLCKNLKHFVVCPFSWFFPNTVEYEFWDTSLTAFNMFTALPKCKCLELGCCNQSIFCKKWGEITLNNRHCCLIYLAVIEHGHIMTNDKGLVELINSHTSVLRLVSWYPSKFESCSPKKCMSACGFWFVFLVLKTFPILLLSTLIYCAEALVQLTGRMWASWTADFSLLWLQLVGHELPPLDLTASLIHSASIHVY